MNPMLYFFRHLLAVFVPSPCAVFWPPEPPIKEELLWANTGGPKSRIVSTPLVSRLLSRGSEALGLTPLGHYELQPRHAEGGFRDLARHLLIKAGFETPELAWKTLCDQLPNQAALAVDAPSDSPPDIPHDSEHESLIAALVLGKCCGSLFSPARPIIWSERRLARSLRLVHCDSETFTREDDE